LMAGVPVYVAVTRNKKIEAGAIQADSDNSKKTWKCDGLQTWNVLTLACLWDKSLAGYYVFARPGIRGFSRECELRLSDIALYPSTDFALNW